jgi:hypothetical protein
MVMPNVRLSIKSSHQQRRRLSDTIRPDLSEGKIWRKRKSIGSTHSAKYQLKATQVYFTGSPLGKGLYSTAIKSAMIDLKKGM